MSDTRTKTPRTQRRLAMAWVTVLLLLLTLGLGAWKSGRIIQSGRAALRDVEALRSAAIVLRGSDPQSAYLIAPAVQQASVSVGRLETELGPLPELLRQGGWVPGASWVADVPDVAGMGFALARFGGDAAEAIQSLPRVEPGKMDMTLLVEVS